MKVSLKKESTEFRKIDAGHFFINSGGSIDFLHLEGRSPYKYLVFAVTYSLANR